MAKGKDDEAYRTLRDDATVARGFMSGLHDARRDMEWPEGDHSPFRIGYESGKHARDEIIARAVAEVKPEQSSRERLKHLVESAETFLADIEAGNGFTTEEITTEVARARVHLADTDDA